MEILKTILSELWYMLLIVILAFIIMELTLNLIEELIVHFHKIKCYKQIKKRINDISNVLDKKEK